MSDEHNPDKNPNWTPRIAWRVYACEVCGAESKIQTNHTGKVWSHQCAGTCRTIYNAHTENERVFPADTVHVFVKETGR